MTVVINDFEIIAEPGPAPRTTVASEAPEPDSSTVWTAQDIERIVQRKSERADRVRAD